MTDQITLTMPRERQFLSVAHLVLGGVCIRLNLTIETLEDLQLALDAILERDRTGDDVTISLRVAVDAIETEVGPLHDGVRRDLEKGSGGEEVGLRRILDTLVDAVDVEVRDDGHWVKLRKTVEGRES